MSRLIDADKLKNHYSWWNNEEKELFDSIVDAQPTAYDVEKIVENLEEDSFITDIIDNGKYELIEVVPLNVANEMIRKGGINETD